MGRRYSLRPKTNSANTREMQKQIHPPRNAKTCRARVFGSVLGGPASWLGFREALIRKRAEGRSCKLGQNITRLQSLAKIRRKLYVSIVTTLVDWGLSVLSSCYLLILLFCHQIYQVVQVKKIFKESGGESLVMAMMTMTNNVMITARMMMMMTMTGKLMMMMTMTGKLMMMMMTIGSCLSMTCWLAGPSSPPPRSDDLFNGEEEDAAEDDDLVEDDQEEDGVGDDLVDDDGQAGGVPPCLCQLMRMFLV